MSRNIEFCIQRSEITHLRMMKSVTPCEFNCMTSCEKLRLKDLNMPYIILILPILAVHTLLSMLMYFDPNKMLQQLVPNTLKPC